jgi:hypothetical protein
MSITNLTSPTGKPSCQDALWHVALSNNSGQTDFKYVFDVFTGNNTQQLIRVKVYPNPTDGRGYFDASRVVKNEITYDWFIPDNGLNNEYSPYLIAQANRVDYTIRVGEDVSGITTLNMASGTTSAYNYVAPMLKRRQQDISVMNWKFLTNRPRFAKVGLGEKLLIPLMLMKNLGDVPPTIKMNVKAYNESNTLLFNANSPAWYEVVGDFLQLDIGSDAVTYATDNNITSSVKYYDIKFDVNGSFFTESFRVFLDCDPRYTPINLFFMNHFGMFDTARFSLSSTKMMNIQRKSFERNEYNFNNGSVEYFDANNVYNESKINYNSKSNWSYKLTMNYPTDQEYEWLAELIDSPQIYASIDGCYYPVTLKATTYEYSKYQNDKLKEFTIDIEMNQTRFGFRR